MKYNTYSAEYKLSLIEEFQSRKISMRAYCKEKDVPLNTFISWIKKVKTLGKENIESFLRKPENNSLTPIDVSAEVKNIINDENYSLNNVFTMEIKGIKFTFAISNLKEVIEVIK